MLVNSISLLSYEYEMLRVPVIKTTKCSFNERMVWRVSIASHEDILH